MKLNRKTFVLVALLGSVWMPGRACAENVIETITKPSKEIILKFLMPGRIADVLVKDGEHVANDQLLIMMDDEAEQIKLQQIQAEAQDQTRVQAARAEQEYEQAYLDELIATPEAGTTKWELKRQELKVQIAAWKHKLAEFERDKYKLQLDEAEVRVARMQLRSPFAGTAERVLVKPGAATNSLEEVIWLVQTDPLWVEAPVDLAQARQLKLDQLAEVTFPDASAQPVQAKIIHKASVANAGKLMVRLEVPNPANRPAGETVSIRLPGDNTSYETHKTGLSAQKPTEPNTIVLNAKTKE